MKIMILGSTGMLGQALLREAKQRRLNTVGIARNGADISVDITNCHLLKKAIADIKPEIIINAAAMVSHALCEGKPGAAYLVNARSTAVMAEAAYKIKAYMIQVSTDHYFTGDGNAKHSETSPIQILNEYARTKYAGECFALTYSNTLVVRTNIVGFRHNNKKNQLTFAEWVIQTLKKKSPITLFDDYFTSSIHTDQFSVLLFNLLDKHPKGILNLACRDVTSKKKFIKTIASRLGYSLLHAKTGSVLQTNTIPRAESLGLDVTCAENILGYHLPTLKEVIDSLILKYKETYQ